MDPVANFGQGPVVWGPRFRLNPAFSEKQAQLLGRADFFQVFSVSFQESPTTLLFHLNY